jgi:hypothetical protein
MNEIDFVGLAGSFCSTFFKETEFFELVFVLKVPDLGPDPIHHRFLLFFCGWKI